MISEAYRQNIINFFGETGKRWLAELPDRLKKYEDLWGLSDLKVCQLSYNFVATCHAKGHGPAVLKIALPDKESLTEMHALDELHHHCKVYEKVEEDYVMLLEQIQPGHDLWTIKDLQERLDIAGPLIDEVPAISYSDLYPNHLTWLDNITTYLKQYQPNEARMIQHLDQVIKGYASLDVPGNDIRLLHGDLHHYNILKDHEWRVIDPKGVIGRRSLEVGRYMNNQIQEAGIDREKTLKLMVDTFARILQLPKAVILWSFYTDMVLSTAWYFEGDSQDRDHIDGKIDICDWILGKYL